MFHDIGMLKLPKSLQNVSPEDMSPEEKKYYHLHPQLGLDMLGKFPEFTTQAKLIILEHHETKDGTGFPRGISGGKIFPLAQIIGLCDYFAIELKKKKILPNDLVSNMANDLRLLDKYDHEIILALKNSFK